MTLKQIQAGRAAVVTLTKAFAGADMAGTAGELARAVVAGQLLGAAVGACVLAAIDWCNATGTDVGELDVTVDVKARRLPAVDAAMDIVAYANDLYRTGDFTSAVMYVATLKYVCALHDLDFYHCVEQTWSIVKGRVK